ncbi:MAG: SNF2-related protein [Acidobacteriota bacterium]
MGLFVQIGQKIGKTVLPIKQTRVINLPIPQHAEPELCKFPKPAFEKIQIFRISKGIIQEPQITTNLLFSLSDINWNSDFKPLISGIFRFQGVGFNETRISANLVDMFSLLESKTWVSENLFVLLEGGSVNGKKYGEQGKTQTQSALFKDFQSSAHRSEFKKAYTRVKTRNALSTHATYALSVWDLIYPILLPPLTFDFVPQFDILEKLRPYQKTGISFLVENQSALLADEMGTGKTVMSAVALRLLFRLGKVSKALIICPVNILRVWQDHLLDWASELELTVVRGSKETRKLDWQYPAHVYLTTYETVASDFLTVVKKKDSFNCPKCGKRLFFKEKITVQSDSFPQFECPSCKTILDNIPLKNSLVDSDIFTRFDIVIIDEAQYIKNSNSDRSRAVKLVKPKFRWALTGTPVENKLDDLVSIFEFVKPNYLRKEGLTPSLATKYIKPYFLRRLKEDVLKELPPKIKQDIWLELDESQKVEYQEALRGGVSELESLGDKVSKVHVFKLLTQLKQICNFAKDRNTSSKTKALIELVEEIKDNGQKLLVFSQYVDYGISKLETLLKPFGVAVLKGGLSDQAKRIAIDKFKSDSEITVFLSTIKTGGVGLTLTEASYVIHFDHWWNPALMWQAEDRVHRHGKEHWVDKEGKKQGVNIYSFWMQETIEERIHEKLREKGLLFDEVVNGLSEEIINEMISTDEWLDMLGVKTNKDKRVKKNNQATESSQTITSILESLFTVNPIQFEEVVKSVFTKIGFTNVRTTKRSHDGGIDIIGYRRSVGGTEKTIAQCKRTSRVGVEVARELLGVIAADHSIAKGFLVTSGTVSPECRAFCEKDGRLSIIEGLTLATYILQFGVIVTE